MDGQADRRTQRITWTLALALLLGMTVLVTLAQRQMAPTFDEQNHVVRGIAILRTGDYRLCYHHPPLANILEGVPAAWQLERFPTEMPAWSATTRKNWLSIWEAASTVIWGDLARGVRLIHDARLATLLFMLVLGAVIFLWSRELFGPWGSVLSLGLYALDPNFLAHSGLATTDAAAACTIALAVYLFRRYVKGPTLGTLLVAGIGIGLALAAKFSALILIPVVGLLILLIGLWPRQDAGGLPAMWQSWALPRRVGAGMALFAVLGLVAGITLWGTYGFKVEPLGSKPGQPLVAGASVKDRIPVPAMQYLRGLKTVATQAEEHPTFLLGMTKKGEGWWYYFPVAVVTKMPIPALFLLFGMLVLLIVPGMRTRLGVRPEEWVFLFVPAGIFLAAALGLLGISLNLGVRHVLPMLPFLYILAGAWAKLPIRTPVYAAALVGILAVQGFSVLSAYPDFISYFNEVAGGPEKGYKVLIDSNYDWGQDIGRLAELQRAHNLRPMAFSYFGTTPPEAYGLDYTPMPGFGLMSNASPQNLSRFRYLAISVTNLVGGPGYTQQFDYRNFYQTADKIDIKPDYRAGRTIFVYENPGYLPLIPQPRSGQR